MKSLPVVGLYVAHAEILKSHPNREHGNYTSMITNSFDSYCSVTAFKLHISISFLRFCSSDFFCLSCNDDVVAPQTRTHLEVLVRVQSFPNAHVTVKVSSLDFCTPIAWRSVFLQTVDSGPGARALPEVTLFPVHRLLDPTLPPPPDFVGLFPS